MQSILLIHPPLAKPAEPPAGIARLAGALRSAGLRCTLLDANLEGQLSLLGSASCASDTWSRRAFRNLDASLASLRTPQITENPARYRRAVADINRVLEVTARQQGVRLGLANYEDAALSPQKSGDLIRAASRPETNLFFPYFSERLTGILDGIRPQTVGLSLNYLAQAVCSFAILGFIRQRYSGIRIVLGGGLVTSWLSNPAWRNPFTGLVDHLVSGPGEEALLSLLGREQEPGQAPPDYQQLPLGEYLSPEPVLPYAASSGCYWRKCSFCPEKTEAIPYRALPVKQVLKEVETLRDSVRPGLLHFLDNAVSPSLMKGLIERPPGLKWYGFGRITSLLADPDFCRALRKSGCVLLKLGLESGDQKVLDETGKGTDLSVASEALQSLKRAGIATYVYLLFGTPAESIAGARRTLEFVVRHREGIGFLNLAVFNMPVGCPDARTLAVRKFYEGDLSLYTDFEHPLGWNRREVRRFLDQEFRRHPDIAPILRRNPPHFTSNHAAFFV